MLQRWTPFGGFAIQHTRDRHDYFVSPWRGICARRRLRRGGARRRRRSSPTAGTCDREPPCGRLRGRVRAHPLRGRRPGRGHHAEPPAGAECLDRDDGCRGPRRAHPGGRRPKVVGIVVTGEGRAFCAGADMNLLSGISGGGGEHALTRPGTRPAWARDDGSDDFAGRFPYVMAIDKPVIAAINGAVAGMAFPFALCCDIRVVSPERAVRERLRPARADRRVGSVVAAATTGRAGGGARPAVLVAPGRRRGGLSAGARQLPRRAPTS